MTLAGLIVVGSIFKSNGKIIMLGSSDIFLSQVKLSAVLIGFILIPIIWVIQIKPIVIAKLGYYYVGSFEVRKKINLINIIFILSCKENSKWLFVNRLFFDSIKNGEGIDIKLSCLGSLVEIQKIKNSHYKIKKLIKRR